MYPYPVWLLSAKIMLNYVHVILDTYTNYCCSYVPGRPNTYPIVPPQAYALHTIPSLRSTLVITGAGILWSCFIFLVYAMTA